MAINWIKMYNRLFPILNVGETYHSGPQFLDVIREVDDSTPSYQQLLDSRIAQDKNTSRKDYYFDVINDHTEAEKIAIYNAFIQKLEPLAHDQVQGIRELLQEGAAGPVAAIPAEVWNSDRLTAYLEDMDTSIIERNYNRTLTLAYTCLEGFYKAFIRSKIPAQIDLDELNPMAGVVRAYIRGHLLSTGIPFPDQMITLIPTITNAVSNSRNHYSDAHFADESDKWLAEFARDCVNSIVRMLLKFI